MRVTVAICTWNRCELLRQTLEEMTKLVIPPGVVWELLVVNNNCTDATDEVIASFTDRLPIRRLLEPRPGKSHALNLATREARGDYIIWTDDDVLVDARWIWEYCKAFSRWRDAAIFGGPVLPLFEGSPPRWMATVLPRIGSVYAIRNFGDEAIPFSHNVIPFGLNLAVRAKDQADYLYDTRLGPRPNSSVRGEETALVRKMLAEGVTGWWVPTAVVQHYIPKGHQTIRYVRRYFSGQGELSGRLMPKDGVPKIFGKPRWLWRQAIEEEFRYRIHRVLCRPEVWIEDLVASSMAWGQLRAFGSRSFD